MNQGRVNMPSGLASLDDDRACLPQSKDFRCSHPTALACI